MMAPCDRLSTPETPKISVNPVAPSAYSALMAKPSIRICRVSIGLSLIAAGVPPNGKTADEKMLPGEPGSMMALQLVRRDLDEARELQLGLGHLWRPDRDLL